MSSSYYKESMIYDVIIVGAGIEGSATGYYLTSNYSDKNVLLLEQFDKGRHTRGSSHGGSRISKKAFNNRVYVQMMEEGFDMWSDIEIKSGNQLYQNTGVLVLGVKGLTSYIRSVESFIQSLNDNSVSHQLLSVKEVNERYCDQLQIPDDYLCVFEECGGILRASKAVTTLQELFVKQGGHFLDNHQVTSILPTDDIITVQTERGNFKTKKLILTTGAWTNKILHNTGLQLPLKVCKAEVHYWKTEDPGKFSVDNFPVVFGNSKSCYVYCTPVYEYPGLIKICTRGMAEIDPDARDVIPSSEQYPQVSKFIQEHFKGVDYTKPAIFELCMITMAPNGDAFIDRHPDYPNIIIGAGFSARGFCIAPVVGKILSELVLDLPPSYDMSPFKIGRSFPVSPLDHQSPVLPPVSIVPTVTNNDVYDVIIIGAGVEGSATAYYLSSKGTNNILLLEQFDKGCHTRGSSHGGSRITRKAYHKGIYVQMMEEGFDMWSDIEIKSGNQLYQKTGVLVFGPAGLTGREAIENYIQSLNDNSVSHQLLSVKEVNERYCDQLQIPDDYLCVFEECGGILRASKAVTTLQELFVKQGGHFLDNHQVTSILPIDDIITVQTERGNFKTKKLILTTGAWTNKILQNTGLQLPLKVLKAEVLYWQTDNSSKFKANNFPTVIGTSESSHIYSSPVYEYPGLIKICPSSKREIDPDARDVIPSSKQHPEVSKFIQEHFKGVDYTKPAIFELCMITKTPSDDPFLDRHPDYPNIIIGAGFSGHGFKLAPVVGKILSELVLDLPPSYDMSPFKINRDN